MPVIACLKNMYLLRKLLAIYTTSTAAEASFSAVCSSFSERRETQSLSRPEVNACLQHLLLCASPFR